MIVLASALIVAAAVGWAGMSIAAAIKASHVDPSRDRAVGLLSLLAPGIAAASDDPRALLAWQPLAATARKMFPEAFAALDAAAGATFPFSKEQLQAAHSRWTAQWLAWEQRHDAESKLKAAEAEHAYAASGASPLMRARCDAVEREKLETYQRRYEEYIRVAKALQGLQAP
jgi:hypothetical protein